MQTFTQSLQSARDIKIVVGSENAQSFFVQQQLLESVSNYFVKALGNQYLGDNSEPGVLKFPEDDSKPWEILLYWIYKGDDDDSREALYTDQDLAAMLALLRNSAIFIVDVTTLSEAVKTRPPPSPMRKLMAEEAVITIAQDELKPSELSGLGGYDFVNQVLEMQVEGATTRFDRGVKGMGEIKDYEGVNEYMVGDRLTYPNEDYVRRQRESRESSEGKRQLG